MVQAVPSVSLPSLRTCCKSSSFRKPSKGLKIPWAMFSTSVRMSRLTSNVFIPTKSLAVMRLFTSFPPCGRIDTLFNLPNLTCPTYFSRDPNVGHIPYEMNSPTTTCQLENLLLASLPWYKERILCSGIQGHVIYYTESHYLL